MTNSSRRNVQKLLQSKIQQLRSKIPGSHKDISHTVLMPTSLYSCIFLDKRTLKQIKATCIPFILTLLSIATFKAPDKIGNLVG